MKTFDAKDLSDCRRPLRLDLPDAMAILIVVVVVSVALQLIGAKSLHAQSGVRPNIVFILADDLAWSDLGCYGHAWHETPNLDRLASEGIRFTDAYAPAPICSASRASILTGKTPARLQFEFVTKNEPGRQQRLPGQQLDTPPYTLYLPLEESTIAELLQHDGYATAFFGKWHLNPHHNGYLGWSPTLGPRQQGFQTATEGFGSHPYGYPKRSTELPRIVASGVFPSDSVTDHAVEFLSQDHHRPFFLMVSHFYVHTPVDTRCDWLLEKYESKVPGNAPARNNRVKYGAFVETLDHYVGQLIRDLDEAGHRDDTLVVFTSDNGGHPEYASNSPLRGSKWNLYEGGIRVPMIARWPKVIPAGRTSSTPVVGYDLLPTFADVGSGELRSTIADDVDGHSLAGVFRDPGLVIERDLYWHFPYYHPERGYGESIDSIGVDDFAISKTKPQSAIRRGKHKLLRFYEDQAIELYDLSDDVGESDDLRDRRRGVADDLANSLGDYLRQVEARIPDR